MRTRKVVQRKKYEGKNINHLLMTVDYWTRPFQLGRCEKNIKGFLPISPISKRFAVNFSSHSLRLRESCRKKSECTCCDDCVRIVQRHRQPFFRLFLLLTLVSVLRSIFRSNRDQNDFCLLAKNRALNFYVMRSWSSLTFALIWELIWSGLCRVWFMNKSFFFTFFATL